MHKASGRCLLPEEGQWLGNLPALTHMTLVSIETVANIGSWRKLPLQHISLFECGHLELGLFTPGALTQLTSISINTECSLTEAGDQLRLPDSEGRREAGQLFYDVGTSILQLPQLQKLRCLGPLYKLGLRARLKACVKSGRFRLDRRDTLFGKCYYTPV